MAIRYVQDAFNPLKGPVTYIDRHSVSSKTSDVNTGQALVASPYGQPIPILFGKVIVDGVPIWSSKIINSVQITTTTDSEIIVSRGNQAEVPVGSSQVSNIIGSTASFAVAFGTRAPLTNKCTILRLWVNAVLVYDQTDGTSIVDSGQYVYRLYEGDETQIADPTIVNNEGPNSPAFRGLIYAVFDDFPLPDSGGAFPNIMAEISCSTGTALPVTPFQESNTVPVTTPSYSGDNYLINWNTGELIVTSNSADWDVYDMNNLVKKSHNVSIVGVRNDMIALSLNGLYAYTYTFSISFHMVQSQTGAELLTMTIPNAPNWFAPCPGCNGVEEFIMLVTTVGGALYVYERNSLSIALHQNYTVRSGNAGLAIYGVTDGRNKFSNPAAMSAAPQVDLNNFSFFYMMKLDKVYRVFLSKNITPSSETMKLAAGEFPVLYLPRIKSGGTDPLTNSWTVAAGIDGITEMDITFATNEQVIFAMTGPADDPWLTILVNNDVAQTSFLRRYDSIWNRRDYAPQDLAVLDAPSFAHMVPVFDISVPYHHFGDTTHFISQMQRRPGSTWLSYLVSAFVVQLLNFETGEMPSYDESSTTFVNSGNSSIVYGFQFTETNTFDPLTGTLVYPCSQGGALLAPYPGRAALWVVDDNGLLLSQLLLEYCLAAGYNSGDIDVTGVASNDTTLIGSIINTSVDLAQLLGQVCLLFRVDVIESEGKIKFSRKSRGAGMVIDFDLTDADLAPLAQSSKNDATLVDSDRKPSLLPTVLITNYLDYDHLCAIGSQSARRIKFPFPTTKLLAQETLNVPVVMTAADALYWTTFCLFDQWAGETLSTIRTSQQRMTAEPGDLVRITRDDGNVYLMKAETTIVNADLSTSIIARTFNQYLDPPVPPVVPGLPRDKLTVVTDVQFLMIDNFLYDPASDPGDGSQIPYRYAVDQATALQILRGSGYTTVDVTSQTSPIGSVFAALPDRPYNLIFQTDDLTTIKVTLTSGDPDSIQTVSEADFLAGVNTVAIGFSDHWEMIYFGNVVHNADKSITLSHLLRGQRGTDIFAAGHTHAEFAVFLPFRTLVFPIAELGSTEKFHALNLDAPSRPAPTITWSSNGGPLRPWAPAQPLAAFSSLNVVLTWVRRTRAATALHDLDGNTPLGEATEAYEVDIYKGGVVVRTYTGLTTPTATYSSADQTTDTNTITTTIEVAIYQISAAVGRGWPRHVILPVG